MKAKVRRVGRLDRIVIRARAYVDAKREHSAAISECKGPWIAGDAAVEEKRCWDELLRALNI